MDKKTEALLRNILVAWDRQAKQKTNRMRRMLKKAAIQREEMRMMRKRDLRLLMLRVVFDAWELMVAEGKRERAEGKQASVKLTPRLRVLNTPFWRTKAKAQMHSELGSSHTFPEICQTPSSLLALDTDTPSQQPSLLSTVQYWKETKCGPPCSPKASASVNSSPRHRKCNFVPVPGQRSMSDVAANYASQSPSWRTKRLVAKSQLLSATITPHDLSSSNVTVPCKRSQTDAPYSNSPHLAGITVSPLSQNTSELRTSFLGQPESLPVRLDQSEKTEALKVSENTIAENIRIPVSPLINAPPRKAHHFLRKKILGVKLPQNDTYQIVT